MRQMQELSAQSRGKTGKGPAYQTRLKGLIPAIVYGGTSEPLSVAVEERVLIKMHGTGTMLSTLLMLDVDGKKTRVIPRAIQLHPVTDRPVHVDFMRLEEGARIALNIPVHFKGQELSPGIKKGGVLNIVRHEVELYCPADNIPEYIEADISAFDIGDSLHISYFKLPEGVRSVIQGRDFTIATLSPPTTYTEEKPVVAAAAEGAAPAAGADAKGAAPAADAKKAPEKK